MDLYYKGNKVSVSSSDSSSGGSSNDVITERLFFEQIANQTTRTNVLDNEKLYNTSGTVVNAKLSSTVYGITSLIEVEDDTVYKICGRWNGISPCVFLDNNKSFISAIATVSGIASVKNVNNASINPILIGKNTGHEIPSNCKYLCVQSYTIDSFEVLKAEYTETPIVDYVSRNRKLDGKTIVFFGDSICYGVGSSFNGKQYGFAEGVQELAPECTCISYAVGGAYWKDNPSVSPQNRIITQMELCVSQGKKPDIIVIEGGINDADCGTLQCTVSDTWSNFDNSTIWGGLEEALLYITTQYPNAKILYVTNHYVKAYTLSAMNNLVDGISKICSKWSIPLLNNIQELGMPTRQMENIQLHPPYWFHKRYFAPRIYSKLLEL